MRESLYYITKISIIIFNLLVWMISLFYLHKKYGDLIAGSFWFGLGSIYVFIFGLTGKSKNWAAIYIISILLLIFLMLALYCNSSFYYKIYSFFLLLE